MEDLSITGEVGQTMIRNKAKYVRTMQELDAAYMAFVQRNLETGMKSKYKDLGRGFIGSYGGFVRVV